LMRGEGSPSGFPARKCDGSLQLNARRWVPRSPRLAPFSQISCANLEMDKF
jgi:hypothetical protein